MKLLWETEVNWRDGRLTSQLHEYYCYPHRQQIKPSYGAHEQASEVHLGSCIMSASHNQWVKPNGRVIGSKFKRLRALLGMRRRCRYVLFHDGPFAFRLFTS